MSGLLRTIVYDMALAISARLIRMAMLVERHDMVEVRVLRNFKQPTISTRVDAQTQKFLDAIARAEAEGRQAKSFIAGDKS